MAYIYKGKNRDVTPAQPVQVVQAPLPPPKPARPQFDPSQCGTYAGYGQHRRHKVPQCRPCLDAQVRYKREWLDKRGEYRPRKRAPFQPEKCGTYAGYLAHLRHKITPCVPCKAAHNEYMTEYRTKRKAAQELAEKHAA